MAASSEAPLIQEPREFGPFSDRVLIHVFFKIWRAFYRQEQGGRCTLALQYPWMTVQCLPWYDYGKKKTEYWQLMEYCPYCRCSLMLKTTLRISCCLTFDTLIERGTTVCRHPSFSHLHSHDVHVNYPRRDDAVPEYWIRVLKCIQCGGPLSSARRPCCRSLIGRS